MQQINPASRCTNCRENNAYPEGAKWCETHCAKATGYQPVAYDRGNVTKNRVVVREWGGRTPQRVECIETGEIFESALVLANMLDMCESSVNQCCRGNTRAIQGKQYRYIGSSRPWMPVVERKKPEKAGPTPKKVVHLVTNVEYLTRKIMCEELKISQTTAQRHLSKKLGDPTKLFAYVEEVQ